MTVLLISIALALLSYVVSAALMPKPRGKPIPMVYGTTRLPGLFDIQIEEQPEPEFDPSAFWLYPDWDGPLKQPFWMRPLKLPDRFANLPNFSGHAMIPGVRYRTSSGGSIMVRDLAEENWNGRVDL